MEIDPNQTLSQLVDSGAGVDEIAAAANTLIVTTVTSSQLAGAPDLPTLDSEQMEAIAIFVFDGVDVRDVDAQLSSVVDALVTRDTAALGKMLVLVKSLLTIRPNLRPAVEE